MSKSIDLYSKLSLTNGENVNYDQSVQHLLCTSSVGIGDAVATFETDK